jgi:hypothetical protein
MKPAKSRQTEGGVSLSFTLFELILVILIMGIIITFVGNQTFASPKKSVTIRLDNLPQTVRMSELKSVDFYILGMDCDKTAWLTPEGSVDVEFNIDIPEDLIPYRFNYYGEMRNFEFQDLMVGERRERVCLKFQLFENETTSSLIIEDRDGDKYYLYRPYFQKPEIFDSLQDAKDALLGEDLNPKVL